MIFIKDSLRAAVEAASGGTVTVLYTAKGQPTYMHVIPRFNLQDIDPALGNGTHPAFIVNGVEKSELFIGQHTGCLRDGELLSLPGVEPLHSVTFDEALAYGSACGLGFHAMTHAEQSAIAHWCKKMALCHAATLPTGAAQTRHLKPPAAPTAARRAQHPVTRAP